MVHNREFTSLLWFVAPAGCECIPNMILQPSVPTCWVGWSLATSNMGDHASMIAVTVWQYPCEDLIIIGQLDQMMGWFTMEEHTLKEVIARE